MGSGPASSCRWSAPGRSPCCAGRVPRRVPDTRPDLGPDAAPRHHARADHAVVASSEAASPAVPDVPRPLGAPRLPPAPPPRVLLIECIADGIQRPTGAQEETLYSRLRRGMRHDPALLQDPDRSDPDGDQAVAVRPAPPDRQRGPRGRGVREDVLDEIKLVQKHLGSRPTGDPRHPEHVKASAVASEQHREHRQQAHHRTGLRKKHGRLGPDHTTRRNETARSAASAVRALVRRARA